nr:hypothetical protein [Mycobacterium genavense]
MDPDEDQQPWWRRFGGVARLANTPRGAVTMACAFAVVFAIVALMGRYSGTTVHGNLTMINAGAKDTIDCNDGNLRLEGDNNTYTVTGHCRRLDVPPEVQITSPSTAPRPSVFSATTTRWSTTPGPDNQQEGKQQHRVAAPRHPLRGEAR